MICVLLRFSYVYSTYVSSLLSYVIGLEKISTGVYSCELTQLDLVQNSARKPSITYTGHIEDENSRIEVNS